MAHYNYIDVLCRTWGEEILGKSTMDNYTDKQVEKARIKAMNDLSELTRSRGRQPEGTAKRLFCYYIKHN